MKIRSWCRSAACALGLLLALNVTAFAQGALRGEIAGTIKDDTGATLPGVTVSVTSPALQVPTVAAVSDNRGEYRIIDLPAGTYRVQYELSGFGTLVRDGIVLTTGFAAKLDVVLKLATLAETVTVSGESPVVDVTTTRGGTTISQELIKSIPQNNDYRDVMLMVGGMQAANAPLSGGQSAAATGFNGAAYGAGTGSANVEGMRQQTFEEGNFSAYEAVDVKTFGNTADVDQAGANVQLVVKSGGNQFHGRYNEIFSNKNFYQWNNIDDRLRAQGVTTGDSVVWYSDFTADLGGRIIKDKLWFYTNVRESHNSFTSSGFTIGAAGSVFNTGNLTPANPHDFSRQGIGKLSYQMNASNRFTFLWNESNNHYAVYYSRYQPLESAAINSQTARDIKPIEWNATLHNRWVINAFYSRDRFGGYRSSYVHFVAGTPSTLDNTTLQQTGPTINNNYPIGTYQPRQQFQGSVSYLPSKSLWGSHSFQVGARSMRQPSYQAWPGGGPDNGCKIGTQICPAFNGLGQEQLVFDTVGGVPHTGTQINIKTFPVQGVSYEGNYSAYGMDSWRPTNRLTLNLGVRWERNRYWVPPSTRTPSSFPGGVEQIGTTLPTSYAGFTVNDWKGFLPRLAAAYDLFGDGKTVVKATYGQFYTDLMFGYAQGFSPATVDTFSYRWHDLNGDHLYEPGEVNLSTTGPDFINIAGGTTNTPNPNLNLTRTGEASASVERQLGQGFAVRGLYLNKRVYNGFASFNMLRPLSVWNRSFQRQDPGPDGKLGTGDDGSMLTIYDYDPAYRGAAFVQNENINDPNRVDKYDNVELTLTKRPSGRWFANTSLLMTRNDVWRTKAVTTPNDNLFPEGKWWDVSYLLAGGYNLPKGFVVSSLTQVYNGLARQRTNLFRAVDPSGGPSFPSSTGGLSLPVQPQGATKGPDRLISNLRIGKNVNLSSTRKVNLNMDVFNLFNTNVAWGNTNNSNTIGGASVGVIGLSDVSGPTYGNVSSIVQPRSLRFNVGFEF